MSRENIVKEFRRIDRMHTVKKTATITLFAVLLFALLIYAIRIENKLNELAKEPAVVIYRTTVQDTTEETSFLDSYLQQEYYDKTEPSEELIESTSAADDFDYNSVNNNETTSSEIADSNETTAKHSDATTNEHIEDKTAENIRFYVTETGKKYHTEHCAYLKKSKRAVTLSEIENSGYEPCSKCIN